MKTKTINLYEFNELSPAAKQKAIEGLGDINVMDGWWDFVYEDANSIGLIIESFDIDHASCKGKLEYSLMETCDLILKEHGIDTPTYKTAIDFQGRWKELVKKYSDGVTIDIVAWENESDFDNEADELEDDFRKELLEEYLVILRKEYEALISDEMIIETIKANEYTFTKDGKLENL